MTISPGQLAEASSGISSPTSDIYELLLSVRDALSTLQLDSEGEVMGVDNMFIDSKVEEKAKD